MIKSVKKYGGFYVSRYEPSVDEKSNVVFKDASNPENKIITINGDKGNDETQESPFSSALGWNELYEKLQGFETSSVKSSMIWGCQYDAMLNWIIKTGSDISSGYKDKVETIKNKKLITGYTKTDKFNNIYDIYGCNAEWTRDKTIRGDNYSSDFKGINRYSSGYGPGGRSGVSSRATLYLK